MSLYCGIDWASDHHDVAVVDDDGRVVARGRVGNDAAGLAGLLTVLAEAGDSAKDPIPVGIETDRGLWVAALRETGRVIYPINPLAASRYRARYAVSGAKSDATDAVLLANIVRTDAAAHRPLPADTELAGAIRVLARAQQDAVWARQQIGNQIRDLLKDFYPAALVAFAELPGGGLARADARTILAAAPTPAQAVKLTPARLRRLLIQAGRRRDLDRDIERLRQLWLAASPMVYFDKFARWERRSLIIYAKYDLTFLPEFSKQVVVEFARHNLDHKVVVLPCGHYTMGETPYKYMDGWHLASFLRTSFETVS